MVHGRNPAPVDSWFIPFFLWGFNMFQPSFWWCRISSIVSHHKRDDSISSQISISLPGGGVPAEGLYHGGLPLCMADEVAYPSDNAAEVPCSADDAWLDGLMVWCVSKGPGRAVGVLFFCWWSTTRRKQNNNLIIQFLWATQTYDIY